MSNIYDDNQKSLHGPSGDKQAHQGPYGGKDGDKLSNRAAGKVFPPQKEVQARPKH